MEAMDEFDRLVDSIACTVRDLALIRFRILRLRAKALWLEILVLVTRARTAWNRAMIRLIRWRTGINSGKSDE